DEVSVYDNDFPEEEPIDFWDKRKVAGGNSPLAGTPDGLAGPASATFDFIKKPINLSKHAEKSEAVIDKLRSEERRVGKECEYGTSAVQYRTYDSIEE